MAVDGVDSAAIAITITAGARHKCRMMAWLTGSADWLTIHLQNESLWSERPTNAHIINTTIKRDGWVVEIDGNEATHLDSNLVMGHWLLGFA